VTALQIAELQLKSIMPACADTAGWCEVLNATMDPYEINSPHRVAAYLAQIAHESSELNRLVENLNYSAAGLMRTWPNRFPTIAKSQVYARKPEKIANYVYAGRLGNGDETSGDGWRYRGRGLIQITGRENYRAAGVALGLPLDEQPDSLTQPREAARSAAWFWKSHLLNALADHQGGDDDDDDFVRITKKINGGTKGLKERRAYWWRAKQVLGIA
jgi:putative chitinase